MARLPFLVLTIFEEREQAVYELFFRVPDYTVKKIDTMSGGQCQMLALACLIMVDPGLLILGERTAGVQPNLIDDVLDLVQDKTECDWSVDD